MTDKKEAKNEFEKFLEKVKIKHLLIFLLAVALISIFTGPNKNKANKKNFCSKEYHLQDQRFEHTPLYAETETNTDSNAKLETEKAVEKENSFIDVWQKRITDKMDESTEKLNQKWENAEAKIAEKIEATSEKLNTKSGNSISNLKKGLQDIGGKIQEELNLTKNKIAEKIDEEEDDDEKEKKKKTKQLKEDRKINSRPTKAAKKEAEKNIQKDDEELANLKTELEKIEAKIAEIEAQLAEEKNRKDESGTQIVNQQLEFWKKLKENLAN